jgi:hypothetical protein
MKVDPGLVLVLALVGSLVALIAASYILPAKRRKQNATRLEDLKDEATAFLDRFTKSGHFPTVSTNLILREDEVAIVNSRTFTSLGPIKYMGCRNTCRRGVDRRRGIRVSATAQEDRCRATDPHDSAAGL